MQRLSRRQLVVGAGSAALLAGCGRLPWQAGAAPKVARVGVLSPSIDPTDAHNAAFREGLRDLGYAEGQNITLEWRTFESSTDQYRELTADLVRRSVDVLVTQGGLATLAAKQATTTIPIVMAYAADPVQFGLVASLAHPGGNVTGLATMSSQLVGKRLQLLRNTVPGLERVALLWNPETAERAEIAEETAAAAQVLGLDLQLVELSHAQDLESAFATIRRGRVDALFVQTNPATYRYRPEIVAFLIEHGLPTMASLRAHVTAGSLMSYGPDVPGMNHRAAYYVDRILKGTKPADLPVEQPMRFDFVVNMKTARALGITFPHEVALQITEVIE